MQYKINPRVRIKNSGRQKLLVIINFGDGSIGKLDK